MLEGDDVALKLLHTADWHLGKRFPQFSEHDELELMRARMAVIDDVFGSAWSHQVDAVLAAGDLFDTPDPGDKWWAPLLEKIQARDWSERPLFLLPGNHDFLSNLSVWHPSHAFRQGLPPGVHVIDDDDFSAPLGKDGQGVLLSRPCRSRSDGMDNALALPMREPGDERIRIGMVHGSTFEMEGFQSNFPIAKDAAQRRGLDYLAIGDTHAFKIYNPESAPTVYPSAPEPTNFGERNAGYVALVFFARRNRRARIQQKRVARWTWEERTVTDMPSLRRLTEEDLRRTVLKLTVEMKVQAAEYDDAIKLVANLRGTDSTFGKVGVLRTDLTQLTLDSTNVAEQLDGLPDVLRQAAERLVELEDGPNGAVATRALGHLVRLVREAH